MTIITDDQPFLLASLLPFTLCFLSHNGVDWGSIAGCVGVSDDAALQL